MKALLRLIVVAAAAWLCSRAYARLVVMPYRCNITITRLTPVSAQAEKMRDRYAAAILARNNLYALEGVMEACPTEPNLYMLMAQNQLVLGQRETAVETYRRALGVDPRPEIYVALGDVLLALGRNEEASASYKQSERFLAPRRERIRRWRERAYSHGRR